MFDHDELLHEAPDEVVEAAYADTASGDLFPPLDEMAPGPALAAFLAAVDVAALPGEEQVAVLRAQQRMASHFAAATYRWPPFPTPD